MGLPLAARLGTPVGRTSVFYFMLFMTSAVSNPYLGIWLATKGITPEQIGMINALPFLVIIVFSQVVGRLADRAGDWRSTIVIGSVLAAIGPVLMFFTDDYLGLLITWTIALVPFQTIIPVVDAASVRLARRLGADFALMRIWGTVGFVLLTIVVGVLLDWYGPSVFLPFLVVASLMRLVFSFQLPLFRAPVPAPGSAAAAAAAAVQARLNPLVATRLREVWRPWFILPLAGAALIHGSHMMQLGFGALLWAQAGIPSAIIGPMWAVGQLGEIFAMLFFARLARRFSARHLLLLSAIVGVLRWIGFALQPPLWGILLLQFANLFTFGLSYLGVVNFVANWTTEKIAAEAQGFYNVMRQLVTVAVLTGFGFLTAQFGAGAYYGASIMCAVGGVLILASLLLMHPRHEMAR